ncbi:MAG TPA: hypothetical protein VKA15_06650 [Isosphaeraceae bacterium]|nr:hypothetical protein [Isosphaeraceae bacterium]
MLPIRRTASAEVFVDAAAAVADAVTVVAMAGIGVRRGVRKEARIAVRSELPIAPPSRASLAPSSQLAP